MQIVKIQVFKYRLPFIKPLPFKNVLLTEREGLLVRLEDAEGYEGWGEIAPLPSFSEESLAEAEAQLRRVTMKVQDFWNIFGFVSWYPAVRFGLEWALLQLGVARSGASCYAKNRASVDLNGLLVGSAADCLAEAERFKAKGYQAVKLKVGHRALAEDIALVQALVHVLGETCALRLDANQAWSFEEATSFARAMQGLPIAYLEEPTLNWQEGMALTKQFGLPVALDESLRQNTSLWTTANPAAFILKPTLQGSIAQALHWGAAAAKRDIPVVISASVETGLGTKALVAMASYLNPTKAVPIGLDTYNWLAKDVLSPRLPLDQPYLSFEDAFAPCQINHDLLVEVG